MSPNPEPNMACWTEIVVYLERLTRLIRGATPETLSFSQFAQRIIRAAHDFSDTEMQNFGLQSTTNPPIALLQQIKYERGLEVTTDQLRVAMWEEFNDKHGKALYRKMVFGQWRDVDRFRHQTWDGLKQRLADKGYHHAAPRKVFPKRRDQELSMRQL